MPILFYYIRTKENGDKNGGSKEIDRNYRYSGWKIITLWSVNIEK